MIITEPRVEVIAYTQLPPADFGPHGSRGDVMKVLQGDPCSEMARVVERCGRISWKSEAKMGPGTADGFMTRVVNISKDESIAEHASVTLLAVMDRYASHQLVRHRIGAYTQESTHYINYAKKGDQIEVCAPLGIPRFQAGPCSACGDGDIKLEYHEHAWPETEEFKLWRASCEQAEKAYFALLSKGVKHYHARFVLPGALKTELAVTFNLRMWRHVINQRITPNNTPEIVLFAKQSLAELQRLCPEMFPPTKP